MSEEKITTPDSSNIASYAYSPDSNVFTVEFKNKAGDITATWEYSKVPPHVFDDAKKAESIGSFIRSRVAGYYEGRKLGS